MQLLTLFEIHFDCYFYSVVFYICKISSILFTKLKVILILRAKNR